MCIAKGGGENGVGAGLGVGVDGGAAICQYMAIYDIGDWYDFKRIVTQGT